MPPTHHGRGIHPGICLPTYRGRGTPWYICLPAHHGRGTPPWYIYLPPTMGEVHHPGICLPNHPFHCWARLCLPNYPFHCWVCRRAGSSRSPWPLRMRSMAITPCITLGFEQKVLFPSRTEGVSNSETGVQEARCRPREQPFCTKLIISAWRNCPPTVKRECPGLGTRTAVDPWATFLHINLRILLTDAGILANSETGKGSFGAARKAHRRHELSLMSFTPREAPESLYNVFHTPRGSREP